jgi:ABC-2 type transport system ATP-binding protein
MEPSHAPAIEVGGLRKRYGKTTALDGVSFAVRSGIVTGFVGPNGAGKSTTMRIILGLDAPDEGSALVHGQPYRRLRSPLHEVGALLDAGAIHPGRRARDHLLWITRYAGIPASRVGEVLDLVGLTEVARRRAGGFSMGMRQRLGVAAALLGDPAVLLFDEPVNGLDPEGIRWMRQLLRSLAGDGRAVFVSSHLMSELEGTADHVIVLGRGRVIADASVDDLLAAASRDRVKVLTDLRSEATAVLANAGGTVAVSGRDVLAVKGLTQEQVASLLGSAGLQFSEIGAHRASLEEAYMELTEPVTDYVGHSGPIDEEPGR